MRDRLCHAHPLLKIVGRQLLRIGSLAALPIGTLLLSACGGNQFTSCAEQCTGGPSDLAGGAAGISTAGRAGDAEGSSASGGTVAVGAATTGGGSSFGGLSGTGGAPPCDGECKGHTPVCDTGSNECVQCLKASDCKAPVPACDVATNTCVECAEKGDCTDPAKPFCDTTAQHCLACLKQADCTSANASACNTGVCTACTTDAECSNIAGKGVCDAGTCVQCTGKKFAACGQDSGTPLVCDSLKKTCTNSKQLSAGLCAACVSDAQCEAGKMCVLDRFGSPAKDVGYFCHWKKGDAAGGAPTSCSMTGKPYSDTQLSVTSIDGVTSDICTLRSSTCIANNQFGSKDCAVASVPSDAACGFAPGEDSKCAVFDSTDGTYRCTMTCLVPEDCPGSTCKPGAAPRVCSFN